MSTGLDKLLDTLDPARVLDQVSMRVDEAVNSFPMPDVPVGSWDQFRACLVSFVAHVEAKALRLPAPVRADPDYAWGRCVRMLMAKYGGAGDKAAFEMARTGNEGGLYGVLKTLAWQIAEQMARTEIRARVNTYWDQLSTDQRLAASQEYLRNYGHLLPSELVEASAARIRALLPNVLEEHPRILQRLHKIGRS